MSILMMPSNDVPCSTCCQRHEKGRAGKKKIGERERENSKGPDRVAAEWAGGFLVDCYSKAVKPHETRPIRRPPAPPLRINPMRSEPVKSLQVSDLARKWLCEPVMWLVRGLLLPILHTVSVLTIWLCPRTSFGYINVPLDISFVLSVLNFNVRGRRRRRRAGFDYRDEVEKTERWWSMANWLHLYGHLDRSHIKPHCHQPRSTGRWWSSTICRSMLFPFEPFSIKAIVSSYEVHIVSFVLSPPLKLNWIK